MCIRDPWPGIFLTIWGQPERFVETYYTKGNKDPNSKDWRDWPSVSGDGAVQAADAYFRILGRVDDVINVAGDRLGTNELESAAIEVEQIAEAAAGPVVDELRGNVVEIYVSLKPGTEDGEHIAQTVSATIEHDIGKIARPKNVSRPCLGHVGHDAKIMRRVIAGISNFSDVGDITTLANPEIVDQMRQQVRIAKLASGETPRELTDKAKEELAAFSARRTGARETQRPRTSRSQQTGGEE